MVACASTPPRVPEKEEARARTYAERADERFSAGDREAGFELATRALVVRLAACGYDCPEVALSFVQLGDLRLKNGQRGWAKASYRRALSVLEPHKATQSTLIEAVEARLLRLEHDGP